MFEDPITLATLQTVKKRSHSTFSQLVNSLNSMTKDETELAPVDMVAEALQVEHRRRLIIRFVDTASQLGFTQKQIENMMRAIVRSNTPNSG